MNRKYIVSIGVVVSMMSSIASAGFVNDGFERTPGTVSDNGWGVTHSSVAISTAAKHTGSSAAVIPILQTLSNAVDLAGTETNVWTDFWTIPRPFVSAVDAAPAVDANSSAMFFVTNTFWAVVYGPGGSATNVCVSNVFNTAALDPVVNDGSSWRRVSVYHKYGAKNWSFFVDGRPVKVNMAFIDSNVPNYQWFSVQNGGGNASNVTWIDDVSITNRVPVGMADDDGDGMNDAWELMYYGDFDTAVATADNDNDGYNNVQESALGANPDFLSPTEPGGTNLEQYVFNTASAQIDSMQVTNGLSMRVGFIVGSNRVYHVLRSTRKDDSYQSVGSFHTGPGGETNWWVDENALNNDRYFYRLMGTNGPFTATNSETYVFYRQSRATASTYYWVGIPIDYEGSNRLDSTLGAQLAVGLTGGADETTSDSLTLYPGNTYYVYNGKWYTGFNGAGSEATDTVSLGSGVLIRKKGAAGGVGALAGRVPVESNASVNLSQNWNFICWPYSTSNSNWQLGTADGLTGDSNMANPNASELWMYRNGNTVRLRLWSDNTWREWVSGRQATPSDWWYYMNPGDGVFVKKIDAGVTQWTP